MEKPLLIKLGASAAAVASIVGLWLLLGFPTPATNGRVDGVEKDALETKILQLENEVDRQTFRESKFDGVAHTGSITRQLRRIGRSKTRYQRKLDNAIKRRDSIK